MTRCCSATPSGGSRRAAGLLATLAALLVAAAPARADTIDLPPPQSDQLGGSELFAALGAGRDQLPGYLAPGPLRDDELVSVEVSGDGTVHRVSDRQRILLTGTGDYFVRESGPALVAAADGGDAPVLSLGDVVWQGFSPGRRQLAARLELDPQIESRHLPLRIGIAFTAGGRRTPLGADRQVPGAGTVTLTVDNATVQPATLPTAADGPARQLADALDRLRASALRAATGAAPLTRLPTVRTGIPPQLPVPAAGTRTAEQLVPLRLAGSLTITSNGPTSAVTPTSSAGLTSPTYSTGSAGPSGTVRLDTLLRRTARFSLPVAGPGILTLRLTAVPALDPAALLPPRSLPSWAAWAAADPPRAERRAALDLLVAAAAVGSRASAFSPYLGSQLEPAGGTTFAYSLADAAARGPAPVRLTPRPAPIALTLLGVLALLGAGRLAWRRC